MYLRLLCKKVFTFCTSAAVSSGLESIGEKGKKGEKAATRSDLVLYLTRLYAHISMHSSLPPSSCIDA